jgi:glucosyl-dolichyl phosphate glucuronosyltransferase
MMNADATTARPEANAAASIPIVTVAICTRNRAKFLQRAVESVVRQMAGDASELLIVDNASTDETPAVAARLAAAHPQMKVWREDKLGLSVARNTALKLARGRFVLFLDDDAMAEPGWLAAYQRFLSAPPSEKIAVVGGAVIPDYEVSPPKWVAPSHGRFDLGSVPLLMPGGGLSGCNSAYCAKIARLAGLFDEELGYRGNTLIPREESELQERIVKTGGECWWLPGAGVKHHMARERLTIRGMAGSAFNAGRASAIHRLKTATSRRQRLFLRLSRLLAAPFHIMINLVQALFLFALARQAPAVGALCRVTRAAGWAWQLMLK